MSSRVCEILDPRNRVVLGLEIRYISIVGCTAIWERALYLNAILWK
jgi:hypothetical protein